MRKSPRHVPVALALVLGLFSTACITKGTRKVRGASSATAPTLLTATREELNSRIAAAYNSITSFQATVELSASVGSVYKNSITDYQDVHAYILLRKPSDIRLLGKLPVVGSTAFDMVSNGSTFRVLIPPKNKFITGENSAPPVSKNSLENLRPQALLGPMMIRSLGEGESMLLEDDTDEHSSFYVLHFIHPGPKGTFYVRRAVWFNREKDLAISRQREYDEDGLITSDTTYKNWTAYNGISFPQNIDIKRPKDGYGVTMAIEKMEMNLNLADDKFVLNQPPDTQLQVLGATPEKAPEKTPNK